MLVNFIKELASSTNMIPHKVAMLNILKQDCEMRIKWHAQCEAISKLKGIAVVGANSKEITHMTYARLNIDQMIDGFDTEDVVFGTIAAVASQDEPLSAELLATVKRNLDALAVINAELAKLTTKTQDQPASVGEATEAEEDEHLKDHFEAETARAKAVYGTAEGAQVMDFSAIEKHIADKHTNDLISSDKYAEQSGQVCPVCGSTNTQSTECDVSVTGDPFHSDTECLDCGSEWEEKYVLQGYTLIKNGKVDK